MSTHDFTSLFAAYPSVIAAMPQEFTSHEFILELARREQRLYIEALYDYRNSLRSGTAVPFMIVHGVLARELDNFPALVRKASCSVASTDIFGQPDGAALWYKV
jgi:hypothetical protein